MSYRDRHTDTHTNTQSYQGEHTHTLTHTHADMRAHAFMVNIYPVVAFMRLSLHHSSFQQLQGGTTEHCCTREGFLGDTQRSEIGSKLLLLFIVLIRNTDILGQISGFKLCPLNICSSVKVSLGQNEHFTY